MASPLDNLFHVWNIPCVEWDVEYTDEFGEWFQELTEAEEQKVSATVNQLVAHGPALGFPHTSAINGSRHDHMRELRIQVQGKPFRVLYAFDPRRSAILLLGGDKTGDPRWYDINVPKADNLYDEHLETLAREGLI